jgi:quercetin dioxygenase-like cupin family protein
MVRQTAAMGIVRAGPLEAMVGDPDDHRPDTTWRLAVDPGTDGRHAALSFLEERCAVGDRIPLHRHDVDEMVVVLDGVGSYALGGEVSEVGPGDVIFIPAGTQHGTVNSGDVTLHVHAVFPSRTVMMEMLERNPAPGTEGDPPMTTRYDFATGEFEVLGPTRPSEP